MHVHAFALALAISDTWRSQTTKRLKEERTFVPKLQLERESKDNQKQNVVHVRIPREDGEMIVLICQFTLQSLKYKFHYSIFINLQLYKANWREALFCTMCTPSRL